MTAGGTLTAMILASPPRPRCSAAACREGVTAPVATLIEQTRGEVRGPQGPSGGRQCARRLRHAACTQQRIR
eukprot:9968-Pyramimonas_sp.AAC.1